MNDKVLNPAILEYMAMAMEPQVKKIYIKNLLSLANCIISEGTFSMTTQQK